MSNLGPEYLNTFVNLNSKEKINKMETTGNFTIYLRHHPCNVVLYQVRYTHTQKNYETEVYFPIQLKVKNFPHVFKVDTDHKGYKWEVCVAKE